MNCVARVAELQRTIELQPGIYVPYLDRGEYYAAAGDTVRAVLAFREYFQVAFPGHPVDDAVVGRLVAVVERRASPAPLPGLLARKGIVMQPGVLTRLFALGGAPDSAFARLTRAIDERDPDVVSVTPFLESLLRGDPRWSGVRARLGL